MNNGIVFFPGVTIRSLVQSRPRPTTEENVAATTDERARATSSEAPKRA